MEVYLHESAHALLEEVDPGVRHQHDACFGVVYAAMLMHCDLAKYRHEPRGAMWIDAFQGYDLSTPSTASEGLSLDQWFPRELAWAFQTAGVLIDRGLDAREIAVEAVGLYARQVKLWELEALQAKQRAVADAQAPQELTQAKAWVNLLAAGSALLCGLLVLLVVTR